MSVSVEKEEKSMAKLTITVSAGEFTKALNKVYAKEKNRISVPGFRKGKAPRKVVERLYGSQIFYEDAANDVINSSYPDAVKESGEDVVSNPQIDISQAEEGKDFIYTAEVALRPPVSLGKYKGVEIEKQPSVEVSDDEVNAQLKRQQEANAKIVDVTDRPVKDGDQITLDYAGTVDGEPFEGGTATDAPLTVGSGSFIPGFEDQLIGAEIGVEKDVNVTFPQDYHAKEVAGKPAVFACTVKTIKEKQLPELNDDFADEVSEFSTLEEYKDDIRKNLADQKAKDARTAKENAAVAAAVDDAHVEIPQAMIDTDAEQLANNFARQIQAQGISFDQYLKYTQMTAQQYVDSLKPQAKQQILNSLVIEEVIKAEDITATDEDVEEQIKNIAEENHMSVDSVRKAAEGNKEAFEDEVKFRKAIAFITDNAVEVEKKEEPKKEDEAESAEAPADAE